jgi:hypothetical protein
VAFVLKVSLLGLAAAGLLLIGLALLVAGVVASDVEMGLLAFLWILAAPFVVFGSMLVREIVRMTREQMAASGREPPGNASAAPDAAQQPAPTTPAVPPGWYPDPYGMPCSRWWDGGQWTEATGPR